MRCIVKVTPARFLTPAYETDEAAFESLRPGNMYKADIRKARNPDHHRKGFALINVIFENQERYRTIEDLLVELKLMTGWYREHIRSDGTIIYVPKSISFADMDQLEFERFYDAVIDIALQKYGLEEALEFIGVKKPEKDDDGE